MLRAKGPRCRWPGRCGAAGAGWGLPLRPEAVRPAFRPAHALLLQRHQHSQGHQGRSWLTMVAGPIEANMLGKSARAGLLSGKQSAVAAPSAGVRRDRQCSSARRLWRSVIFFKAATTTTTAIGLATRADGSAQRERARGARDAVESSPRTRTSVEAALRAKARPATTGLLLLASTAARAQLSKG